MREPESIRQPFDAIFKELLTDPDSCFLALLTGNIPVSEPLPSEFVRFTVRTADLLWRLANGSILHIEIQSKNDPKMPYRMLEYALAIASKYGSRILQIVLYIGREPLNMPSSVQFAGHQIGYRVVDIREVSTASLLNSGSIADTLLSLLTRDGSEAIRPFVQRLASLPLEKRQRAAAMLRNILALRPNICDILNQEYQSMPIRNEDVIAGIREHRDSFFNNAFILPLHQEYTNSIVKAAVEEAVGKAVEEAVEKTSKEAAEKALQAVRIFAAELLTYKFGELPAWAQARVAVATESEIESIRKQLRNSPDASLESILAPENA
jgi:hypothetical protein